MPRSDYLPRRPGQSSGSPPSKATAEAKETFLAALAATGSLSAAAVACNRDRRTAQQWRRLDPAFAERWDAALTAGVAKLETEAWRRAVDGVERPMVSGGKVVATVREYSDSILALLLRAHAPEKYRPKQEAAVSMRTAGPIRVTFKIRDEPDEPEPERTIDGEAEAG